jgi:5-methylcytosine-specific restriction endonuclease McrA
MDNTTNAEVKISPHDPQPDEAAKLAAILAILEHTDIKAKEKRQRIAALLDVDTPAESKEDEAKRVAWQVWQKTSGHCTYCDVQLNPFDRNARNGYHIDHVVPRAGGGSNDIDNLTPACARCNWGKHARTPEEWRASYD